jgi:cyclopropane-fatty-acyl-phospholipid synthase
MSTTSGTGVSVLPRPGPVPRRQTALQRLGRRLFLAKLAELRQGQLTVVDGTERLSFGRPGTDCALHPTIEILHPQTWADVAFGGTVGGGESYLRGFWRCDDLTALIRLFVVNRATLQDLEGGAAIATAPLRRLLHFANRNSRDGSRRNIAAHYDLGNALFELMLDPTMAYSCAIFERPEATLEEAQLAKFERICRRLQLGPADHLVEIGTGWGGLAIHAATHYGCRVTTTTISREQHDYARAKIAAAGLADRIELRLDDYRELAGQYDKLVSVEMIEAVGHQYLDTYVAKCAALLKPAGAMLIQAITIQDQLYAAALRSVDFIQRFIFPGSFIPSVTAIVEACTRATDLKLFHLEDIGPHYATTLARWRENFCARLGEVRRLGYSEEFIRMWEFYLCYCEGGFAERQLGDVHLLFTKPGCRMPVRGLA